jgi:hypothetical protein
MSRTFRRKRERHEYYWVLHDWDLNLPFGHRVFLDPRSKAGRKAIARFHSDKAAIVGRTAPRWYRKASDHQIRTSNDRMYRRWLNNPEFEPIFQVWHKHEASWSWW